MKGGLKRIYGIFSKGRQRLYLQTHFIAIDTKTVSFANIFMEYIETQSLRKNVFKSTVWKRHMDYIFPVG